MQPTQLESVATGLIETVETWCLVSYTDGKSKNLTYPQDETEEQEEKYLLCKQCENRITLPNHRIEVAGNFEHTFLNPGGHVFHIGCFYAADGCLALGVPTAEWTWFEGFEWQVALCNQCNSHLGWFYRSREEQHFYGLIMNLLI